MRIQSNKEAFDQTWTWHAQTSIPSFQTNQSRFYPERHAPTLSAMRHAAWLARSECPNVDEALRVSGPRPPNPNRLSARRLVASNFWSLKQLSSSMALTLMPKKTHIQGQTQSRFCECCKYDESDSDFLRTVSRQQCKRHGVYIGSPLQAKCL